MATDPGCPVCGNSLPFALLSACRRAAPKALRPCVAGQRASRHSIATVAQGAIAQRILAHLDLTLTPTGYLPIRVPPWNDFEWAYTAGDDDAVEKAPADDVPLFDAAVQRPDRTETVRQLVGRKLFLAVGAQVRLIQGGRCRQVLAWAWWRAQDACRRCDPGVRRCASAGWRWRMVERRGLGVLYQTLLHMGETLIPSDLPIIEWCRWVRAGGGDA